MKAMVEFDVFYQNWRKNTFSDFIASAIWEAGIVDSDSMVSGCSYLDVGASIDEISGEE